MSAQKILVGTLTGVVIGLLIAPAKGSETRQKISDSAESIKRKLRSIRGSANDELDELQEIFEHETEGLKDDVRERILKLIEASKKSYNSIKTEAQSN